MRLKYYLSILILLSGFLESFAQTRISQSNGSFSDPGTWTCACIPASTDDIIISSGDTVLLAGATTMANLEIQSNGQLDNNGSRSTITGNYTVNGSHTGAGQIWLTGFQAELNGTGSISNGTNVDIRNDSMRIMPTASLTKDGGGSFRIRGARTLINDGIFTTSRNITGNNAASTLHNRTGAVLNAGRALLNTGVLIANDSGNTVNYNRSGGQTIKVPQSSTYYNLYFGGTGNKNQNAALIIANDLILTGGNYRCLGNAIDLQGDYSNSGGLFIESTGAITFSGDEDQSISGDAEETFYDVIVNKSSGTLILNQKLIASNSLTMTSGNIDARSAVLTLGSGTGNIGSFSRTGGNILGTFSRWVNAGTTTYSFPLGNGLNDLSANFSFSALSDGRLNGRFVSSFPGSSGLPLGDGVDTVYNTFSEGYWKFTDSAGLGTSNYDIQVSANGFGSYTLNPSSRLVSRTNNASNWSVNGSHQAAVAPDVFRDGLTSLPLEFAIGDTTKCTLPTPSTSAIIGVNKVCKGDNAVSYKVTNTPGATYFWTISGGLQASGGNTDSITVDWGNSGVAGSVQVIEYNGCEYGSPVSLDVDIQPYDPLVINGQDIGYENTSNNVYYLDETPGYTYNWSVGSPGVLSGPGSNDSILVNFVSSGTSTIEVFLSNACGNSDTISKSITVVTPIKSITSGNWTSTTTWDCSCNPQNSTTVQISPGHTVTSNATNETIFSVIVDSNATLSIAGTSLRINSALYNNGSISGSGQVRMNQSGGIIGGIGSWNAHTGSLRFRQGTHNILAEANIAKTGGNIQLDANAIVFNEGLVETTANMTGNSTSTWEQRTNSTLQTQNINWTTGTFSASATGNRVIYAGTGTFTRNVRFPVNGQYYDLIIDGDNVNGVYRINAGDLTILNDLELVGGTFDARNTNFNLSISGNWNNTGGEFNERAARVTFNGTGQEINNATRETFFDLSISGSSVNSNTALTIENDLNIAASSTLDMNSSNNYELNIQGDLINSGSINFHSNLLLMDGATTQSINGSISPYDWTIDNTNGVQISSGSADLRNVLDMDNGALTTNNNLTFISDASGTASIADLTGGGSVSGNVTVQRFLNENASAFWYMIGSPVSGSTLADWNSELYMGGFPGSNNPGWGPTVYKYDVDSVPVGGDYSLGYVAPSSISDALNPSEGWLVWLGSSPQTADVTGPLNTGTIATGTLNYTSNPTGGPSKRGWHLRSNPYASPVRWSNVTKSNISNGGEAYVSKADGNYFSVNADNVNHIYSGEAFWVKVDSGGGSLTFNENDKSLVSDSFNFRAAAPNPFLHPLKMMLTYNRNATYSDYSVLRFGGDSNTIGFDNVYGEAYKVPNSFGTYPNISSYDLAGKTDVYYNSLNPLDSSMTIPLRVWKSYPANRTENYNIEFEGIHDWSENNHCLVISDTLNNITQSINATTNSYSWSARDNMKNPYLFLDYMMPIQSVVENISCYGAHDASIFVNGSGSANGVHNYTWYDANLSLIQSDSSSNSGSVISDLSPGTYFVKVSDNGACGEMGQWFTLVDPEPIIADFDAPLEVDLNSGPVLFENRSINANSYDWNFGDGETSELESPSHEYSLAGEYLVELKANQGEDCSESKTQLISVVDYTGLSQIDSEYIKVYSSDDEIFIQLDLTQSEDVRFEVMSVLGSMVIDRQYLGVRTLNDRVSLEGENGIYILRLFYGESVRSFKLLLH